jgi:TMEM175 potassium channel family protein
MAEPHSNARLETFCDGVFAIALTLLIIEVRVPDVERIHSTAELWRALQHLTPSVFAFLLSFGIVLITWVNHHGTLALLHRSSPAFIYANGFLLLTVVFIPFPTALLGAFLGTDHAAPAVVLYDAVLALQGVGWWLLTRSALTNHLLDSEHATLTLRGQKRSASGAIALYSLLALTAFWFPVTAAVVTTATWIFWLILSIRLKTS